MELHATFEDGGLLDMNRTLCQYMAWSKKSHARLLKDKAQQFIMGNLNPAFDGAYESIRRYSPNRKELRQELHGYLSNSESKGIRASARSKEKARALYGAAPSAAFWAVKEDDIGDGKPPPKIKPVYVNQKSNKIIHKSKTSQMMKSNNEKAMELRDKSQHKLLNLQAYTLLIEIRKRVAASGYGATTFLKKRYRRFLNQLPKYEYKSGMAVGVSSTDLHFEHTHRRDTIVNKSGKTKTDFDFLVTPTYGIFKITSRVPTLKEPWVRGALRDVLRNMQTDMLTYVSRKKFELIRKK